MSEKMGELIKRIEAASGPDRELDWAIAETCGMRVMQTAGHLTPWLADSGKTLPAYTASVDAALTLYKTRPERVPSDPIKACVEALSQW